MPYFDKTSIGSFTCPKCGKVWRVDETSFPDKEDNGLACDCGESLIPVHRTRMSYGKTFLRQGDPADAASNPSY